jgi:membrane protease YdiL (CAAX protease family)
VQETAPSSLPAESQLLARDRWISLAECALGTFLVIGHNVFHVVPNEVPFLFLLFWLSAVLRKGLWSAAALKKPDSWLKTASMAIVAAAVLQLGSEFIIQPLANHFFVGPENVSSALNIPVHNWRVALRSLAIGWIFAGFGEEIGYRGYLLTREGVMDSTYSGLVLGGVYLLSGCSLWAAILAHGLSGTFAVFVIFMGWAK